MPLEGTNSARELPALGLKKQNGDRHERKDSRGQALSATTQAVVDICGSGTVKIGGVNVEGGWPSSTCNDNLYDILVGSGANLKLTNSSVLGAGDSPINGCQGGVAPTKNRPTRVARSGSSRAKSAATRQAQAWRNPCSVNLRR